MTFACTADASLIKATITHPKTYKWQCDDQSPAPEDFIPPAMARYITVYDGPEYLGLFCLVPYDTDTWEIHTCLLPCAWGKRAYQAYIEGIQWVWHATGRTRIIGCIRDDNRLALSIARRAGLKPIEKLEIPGSLHYTVVMEIRRQWAE